MKNINLAIISNTVLSSCITVMWLVDRIVEENLTIMALTAETIIRVKIYVLKIRKHINYI